MLEYRKNARKKMLEHSRNACKKYAQSSPEAAQRARMHAKSAQSSPEAAQKQPRAAQKASQNVEQPRSSPQQPRSSPEQPRSSPKQPRSSAHTFYTVFQHCLHAFLQKVQGWRAGNAREKVLSTVDILQFCEANMLEYSRNARTTGNTRKRKCTQAVLEYGTAADTHRAGIQ